MVVRVKPESAEETTRTLAYNALRLERHYDYVPFDWRAPNLDPTICLRFLSPPRPCAVS